MNTADNEFNIGIMHELKAEEQKLKHDMAA